MNTQRPGDGFEDRLLHELKSVVADNAKGQPMPAITPRRRFASKRNLSVGGVAVAGVTAVAAPLLLSGSPAYAVEATDKGARVEINDVTDPEELEDALADAGVPADIVYLDPGMTCADEWHADSKPSAISEYGAHEGRQDDEPMLTFDIEFNRFDPESDVLLLTMRKESEEELSFQGLGQIATVTSGPVSECEQVASGEDPDEEEETETAVPRDPEEMD